MTDGNGLTGKVYADMDALMGALQDYSRPLAAPRTKPARATGTSYEMQAGAGNDPRGPIYTSMPTLIAEIEKDAQANRGRGFITSYRIALADGHTLRLGSALDSGCSCAVADPDPDRPHCCRGCDEAIRTADIIDGWYGTCTCGSQERPAADTFGLVEPVLGWFSNHAEVLGASADDLALIDGLRTVFAFTRF